MKISRDGVLPQFEIGPRLGGMKMLYQRSGVVMRTITMISAMTSAWATSETVRNAFGESPVAFFGIAFVIGVVWMGIDYTVIIPSEQSFNQGQSQRSERSPLKQDTEDISTQLDELQEQLADE